MLYATTEKWKLEFAKLENDGQTKNGGAGWKMQNCEMLENIARWNLMDWKMTNEVAWVKFTGLDNKRLEIGGLENDGLEIDGLHQYGLTLRSLEYIPANSLSIAIN